MFLQKEFEVNSDKPSDLHVKFERRLHCNLKIAVKELGYGTIASWARSMAITTIREAEKRRAIHQRDESKAKKKKAT